jgi:hypothetical protein
MIQFYFEDMESIKLKHLQSGVMVCVDLVGSLTIRKLAKAHSLCAFTMIDPAINHRIL